VGRAASHRFSDLERVEHAECDLALGPKLGRLAEHVEQRLARVLVELDPGGHAFEHDHKAGLRTGLRDHVGQAIIERVVIFAEVLRERELGRNPVKDLGL
jgi:hypothetical protein